MVGLPHCKGHPQPKPYHAIVHFKGPPGTTVSILNDECHECSFWDTCVLNGMKNAAHVLSGEANSFRYIENGSVTAEGKYDFGNLGVYEVEFNNGSLFTVKIVQNPTPAIVLYILPMLLTMLPLFIDRAYEIARKFYLEKRGRNYEVPEYDEEGNRIRHPQPLRHSFLDALRGYALILMIFVNYGGGGLPLMAHSAWYGLTIADIVFPLFLYCSGISLFFTYSKTALFARYHYWRMGFRCSRLIFIGIVLSNLGGGTVRLPGVLQRIGFVIFIFFAAHALLTHVLMSFHRLEHYQRWFESPFAEFLDIGIALVAALIYLLLMAIPTGSCPMFYGGPGGIASHGAYENCTGGFAGRFDAFVFGKYRYQTPTSAELYHTTEPFDPEGVVGSIAVIITLCSGYLAIHLLHGEHNCKKWAYPGITILLLLVGLGMHMTFQPMCKNTWNLPYVLVNAGLGNIFLIFFYKLSHYGRGNIWRFKTLEVMGKYSLLIYMCHEVCDGRFPVQFDVGASTALRMLNSTWGLLFHVVLAYIMDWGKFRINFDVTLGISRYQSVVS